MKERTTKTFTVTLKKETIELLNDYSVKNSINKSALIDRLIREEIKIKTNNIK